MPKKCGATLSPNPKPEGRNPKEIQNQKPELIVVFWARTVILEVCRAAEKPSFAC